MGSSEEIMVPLGDGSKVPGLLDRPTRGPDRPIGLVLGRGQLSNLEDDDLTAVARAAVARGVTVLRYRFPYRAAGLHKADPLPRLLECCRAATTLLRREEGVDSEQLFVGGRSLGGRVASLMVAGGEPVRGLVLLAYPLHTPRDQETLRDGHLYVVNRPLLFVSGDRDSYCALPLLHPVLRRLGGLATLELQPGADHGFHREGETPAERAALLAHLGEISAEWLVRRLAPGAR